MKPVYALMFFSACSAAEVPVQEKPAAVPAAPSPAPVAAAPVPRYAQGIVNPLEGAFKRFDGLNLVQSIWPRMSRFHGQLNQDDPNQGVAIGMLVNYAKGQEQGSPQGELDAVLEMIMSASAFVPSSDSLKLTARPRYLPIPSAIIDG